VNRHFNSETPLRVGCLLSAKKTQNFNWDEFISLARTENVHFQFINAAQSLDDQGPFDIILHKITNEMVNAPVNTKDQNFVHNFEDYITRHPETKIIDKLDNIRKVLNRDSMNHVIKTLKQKDHGRNTSTQEWGTPGCLTLENANVDAFEEIKKHNLHFPIVCKTIISCGTESSHKMAVIMSTQKLQTALDRMQFPVLLQEYINHDAALFKVYVIAEMCYIFQKNSSRNIFIEEGETIFFDSQLPFPDSLSKRRAIPELLMDPIPSPRIDISTQAVNHISTLIRENLNLNLFGFDLLIQRETRKLMLVDINYFPSYTGVPQFFRQLLNYLKKVGERL